MKTKALFSIMLFLCLGAGAQNTILITQPINSISLPFTNLDQVRDWPGTDYAVTLTRTDSTIGFCVINHNQFTTGSIGPVFPLGYAELPSPIVQVHDFCVIDDYVFFCADTFIYGAQNKQVVGYFDLNDIVTFGSTINFTLMSIDSAVSLYKIKGFHDNYGFRVYALGITRQGTTDFPYAIFEINKPIGANNYRYAILDYQYPLYAEIIDDIVFLGETIVFIGRDNIHSFSHNCYLTMRYARKTTGIVDPSFANLHYYANPTTCEYNSSIKTTVLSEKEFAVVYTHTDVDSTRRIRVFDDGLNNTTSQEYTCENKLSIHDLCYQPNIRTLTILEPLYKSVRFIYLEPYKALPYAAPYIIPQHLMFNSLDCIKDLGIISTSPDEWFMQLFPFVSDTPSCVNDSTQKISIIPNIILQKSPFMCNILQTPLTTVYYSQWNNSLMIDWQCISN